jgi:PAS domain S-box-containing protein
MTLSDARTAKGRLQLPWQRMLGLWVLVVALALATCLVAPRITEQSWGLHAVSLAVQSSLVLGLVLVWYTRSKRVLVAEQARGRAEEQAQRYAQQIRLLLDSTRGGICGVDRQGRCTFINRTGAALLGYRPEEVVGQPLHELIHHTRPDGTPYPEEACPISHCLQGWAGGRVDDEVFWRKDGTSFPVGYSCAPVLDEGTVHGAVVTFADITDWGLTKGGSYNRGRGRYKRGRESFSIKRGRESLGVAAACRRARRAWADAAGLGRRGGRRSAGGRATARVWLCGVPPDEVINDLRRAVAA